MGPPVLIGFHNSVIVDGFFLVFAMIFLAATALVILLSVRYLNIEREQEGEYYALLLFSCIGMMFMASGIDLIVLFLGLETMALSFYAMVGFLRREKRSNEAAMKYLLLGAFSTGILAYGFSLLYGVSSFHQYRGDWQHARPPVCVHLCARDHRLAGDPGVCHCGRRNVLQDCGGAVPPVGSRCVRRRAHAHFRVCQRGVEDGEFRDAAAADDQRVRGFANRPGCTSSLAWRLLR